MVNDTLGALASNIPLAALTLGSLGGVAASFSGLAAYRSATAWKEGRSALAACSEPPSRCEGCRRRLGVLELVPVLGWLAFRGRCPTCGYEVPARYPLAEAGAIAAGVALSFAAGGDGHLFASLAFLLVIGVAVSWIDAVTHVIPGELTWALLFVGLLASPFDPDPLSRAAAAATCCAAMWAALAVTGWLKGLDTRAGGDVALAAGAGAWVGTGHAAAFLGLAAATYVAYAAPRRLKGVLWVPMGPALAAALVAVCGFLSAAS